MTRAAPSTPALRVLRASGVAFDLHPYRYEPRGGTRVSARALGVDEHLVLKTLVLQDEAGRPLLMLMHGDREVSLKALARAIGTRAIVPCSEGEARRATGYEFGGTSPFGTRQRLSVYVEQTVAALPRVYVNAGSRGWLVSLASQDLVATLQATLVAAAVPSRAAGVTPASTPRRSDPHATSRRSDPEE